MQCLTESAYLELNLVFSRVSVARVNDPTRVTIFGDSDSTEVTPDMNMDLN